MKETAEQPRTQRLVELIAHILGNRAPKEISTESNLAQDLGFDSIMAIRLMMEFETVFGIDIIAHSDQINFTHITTVGDVARLIERFS